MRENYKGKLLEKILRLITSILYNSVQESHIPHIFQNERISRMAVRACTEIVNSAFTEPLTSPSEQGI